MNAPVLSVLKAKLLWEVAFPTRPSGCTVCAPGPELLMPRVTSAMLRGPWSPSPRQLACAASNVASCCPPQLVLVG